MRIKISVLIVLALSFALTGCVTQEAAKPQQHQKPPEEKPSKHPILGIWSFTENGCTETYEFFSNGTRKGTSGAEITEAIYAITATPQMNNFYILTDKIVRDIGGKGCSGVDIDLTGNQVKLLVRFSGDKKSLVFCSYEDQKQCFGPLIKQEITIPLQ